jgi:hypothetical protein
MSEYSHKTCKFRQWKWEIGKDTTASFGEGHKEERCRCSRRKCEREGKSEDWEGRSLGKGQSEKEKLAEKPKSGIKKTEDTNTPEDECMEGTTLRGG